MCSPRWLFAVPGGAFIAFGLLGYLVAMPGLRIGHSTFDAPLPRDSFPQTGTWNAFSK